MEGQIPHAIQWGGARCNVTPGQIRAAHDRMRMWLPIIKEMAKSIRTDDDLLEMPAPAFDAIQFARIVLADTNTPKG
jgi:hypothetical protein